MLKVIAIDDEYIALERLKRVLKKIDYIKLIDTFNEPEKALEFFVTTKERIDIVFLDIEMPRMNGLELAEKIIGEHIGTDIIFLTAYDQYALEAFKVHAVSYLLKPIDLEEMNKQLNHLYRKKQIAKEDIQNKKIFIQGFGGFSCKSEDGKTIKWRTKKAEELVALLTHYQGKKISREMILDRLWPEKDRKSASSNLYTTCYYIRKKLEKIGVEHFLVRDKENYYIDIKDNQVDFIDFSKKIILPHKQTMESLIQLANTYKGQYLKDMAYEWGESRAIWFENEYTNLQFEIARRYIEDGDFVKASKVMKTLIEYHPLCEKAYKKLIEILIGLNDQEQIKKYYQDYVNLLEKEFETVVSEEMKEIVHNALSS
ncbi:response regulator [Crassaminicella profunda]|uniref:response regulator n=1 Tax=Crassaminicella profunda TaxID=1286698 RepID=UPI001CA67C04|nr:response regulator [Crassaminicella profunda]QZY55770.1 response regulator [Crassaminicella profunda]